jgi:hypothetical protein
MAAERISHPTARALSGWQRDVGPAIDEARVTGARVATSVDVDYGATRPAAAVLIDRIASALVAAVMPDFFHRSARHERKLRRLGPPLLRLRRRLVQIQAAMVPAEKETKAQVERLGEEHAGHRSDGRRSALLGVVLLVVLGLGDVAFSEAVLELIGLPTVTTWMVAAVLGLGQLGALHVLGELNARSRHLQHSTKRAGGSEGLVFLALAVPALTLVGLLGWLRADYLSAQQALAGTSAGHVGFWVAMATFAAIQLLLDGLAFAVGYRFGNPFVKAVVAARGAQSRLEQIHRFLSWRIARREGRIGSVLAGAIGWCDTTKALVDKAWAEQRAIVASLYVGITENTDPLTAAVFCDEEQLSGSDAESVGRIRQALETIDARRAELEALVDTYDRPDAQTLASSLPPQGNELSGPEDEAALVHPGGQDAADPDPSTNGKGEHSPELTKEFK